MKDFDFIKSMEVRRSVRTFDSERPIDRVLLDEIDGACRDLSNPFGVDDLQIAVVQKGVSNEPQRLGTYGVIKGATTFVGMAIHDRPEYYLAGGYIFERLILYITSLGLGTVWLGGTLNRSGFAEAMKVRDDLTLPVITPVGYAEKPRFMERVMRRMAGSDNRKPWSKLFFDESFTSPLSESDAGTYAKPLEMVRIAPSATNTQPWRVLKIADRYHFFAEYPDKAKSLELNFRHIDMGIALCHFGLACRQLELPCEIVTDLAPALPFPANYHYIATGIVSF